MSRPALCILSTQLELAGAQRVALMEARHFHQQGYRVTLCFLYDKQGLIAEWQAREPFEIVDLQARGRGKLAKLLMPLRALGRLWQILRHNNVKIMHSHSHFSNLLGLPVAWLAGVPVRLATQHVQPDRFSPWFWRLQGMLCNSPLVTKLIAVSEQTRQACLSVLRVRPERVVTVPNGVDLQQYDSVTLDVTARLALRTELALPPDAPLVISVARLHTEKGHAYLLQALAKLADQHPKVHLLCVGEGHQQASLLELSASLGLAERVHWLGRRDDVARLLALADIFVLPSIHSEAMSLAILEAMAARLPVIITNVGGGSEVVVPGETGLIIRPEDALGLASAINELLSNPSRATAMGQLGRERVEEKFSWEICFRQYATLMQPSL